MTNIDPKKEEAIAALQLVHREAHPCSASISQRPAWDFAGPREESWTTNICAKKKRNRISYSCPLGASNHDHG